MNTEEILFLLFGFTLCIIFVGGVLLAAHWMGPPDSEIKPDNKSLKAK